MVTLPYPAIAEILADAGFDWLFLDGEHGPLETQHIQAVLQAVDDRIPCIVRVPAADAVVIKRVLDLGTTGIIVPQVNTADTARKVVSAARYAPEGDRGVGLARAHGYGMKFQDYMNVANERTAVIVQAEHVEAVNNIDAIAAVAGIDAVLIGPYDLSASLGRMGAVDDPVVTSAIDRVTEACQKAGVALGYFGVSPDAVQPYVQRGYNLLVVATDTILLGTAAARTMQGLREL